MHSQPDMNRWAVYNCIDCSLKLQVLLLFVSSGHSRLNNFIKSLMISGWLCIGLIYNRPSQVTKTRGIFFVCLEFSGTSTQEGQFVPTAGGWNRLGRWRMTNEIQCIILHTLHNYNVTLFTVKHSSYKTATSGYLILRLALAPSPMPIRITHSLFGIISLDVNAALRHARNIV